MKNGIEVANVDEILQQQFNSTKESFQTLTSGDLEISASSLENIGIFTTERRNSLTEDQLKVCTIKRRAVNM